MLPRKVSPGSGLGEEDRVPYLQVLSAIRDNGFRKPPGWIVSGPEYRHLLTHCLM